MFILVIGWLSLGSALSSSNYDPDRYLSYQAGPPPSHVGGKVFGCTMVCSSLSQPLSLSRSRSLAHEFLLSALIGVASGKPLEVGVANPKQDDLVGCWPEIEDLRPKVCTSAGEHVA
jgi:hypothetical protein